MTEIWLGGTSPWRGLPLWSSLRSEQNLNQRKLQWMEQWEEVLMVL